MGDARPMRAVKDSPAAPLRAKWGNEEEWEGGLLVSCARGTRTIGMCSFDARSGSPNSHPPVKRRLRESYCAH
jgi:hypothetical protein